MENSLFLFPQNQISVKNIYFPNIFNGANQTISVIQDFWLFKKKVKKYFVFHFFFVNF